MSRKRKKKKRNQKEIDEAKVILLVTATIQLVSTIIDLIEKLIK